MPRRLGILFVLLLFAQAAWIAPRAAAESREQELLANADRIAAKVAELRGLALERPIVRGVMNRKQITARLLERIHEEYKKGEIEAEELALKRLKLLPESADYLKMVVDLLTDQVAGFYDPWERQLYIADWSNFGGDMLMAHEIDHALQDQHFDLQKLMKRSRDNNDELVARQALIEGDGTALMLEYSMDKLGKSVPWGQPGFVDKIGSSLTSAMTSMGDAPLVLRAGLIFPYMSGLRFVAHFRKHQPWQRIDRIFKKPPLSTEQILHPRKYESYERPDLITESKPPTLEDYQKLYDNVSGELGLSIYLRQHQIDEAKAARAVQGWGGDRLVLYAPPGYGGRVAATLVVDYSTWDAEADAIEFFEALEDTLASVTGGRELERAGGVLTYRTSRGAVAIAERRKDAVLLVLGAPPARADEVRRQVWEGWTVVRR